MVPGTSKKLLRRNHFKFIKVGRGSSHRREAAVERLHMPGSLLCAQGLTEEVLVMLFRYL